MAIVVVLALVLFAGPPPARAAVSLDAYEDCLLDKVNEARSKAGVRKIQMADDLVPDVRAWSKWMRFNGFQHMPNWRLQQLLPDSSTRYGENIARHSYSEMSDCRPIHDMWMRSTGHRMNILNERYRFVAIGTYVDETGWWATQVFFDAPDYVPLCASACSSEEMFFYRDDGLYRYYDISANGTLGSPIRAGDNYTSGWDSISSVDLDGDGHDEMFFYREDGLYRYYDISANGTLGSPIRAGDNYTSGWDSISSVDLDGDGHDEMFFYRDDGLYRYYDISANGTLGSPIRAGDNYTSGWDSISSVDLDGDGHDEMFFYREDGLYRYYDISANGTLGSPIRAGDNYTSGWDSITSLSLG